jgi:hypothetical protein
VIDLRRRLRANALARLLQSYYARMSNSRPQEGERDMDMRGSDNTASSSEEENQRRIEYTFHHRSAGLST